MEVCLACQTGAFLEFRKEEIEQSIPARFEQQAHGNSGRLAVKTDRCQLTYSELNQAANQVAHSILSRLGAGSEPVSLLLDDPALLIVAILGVLKAGKFCVPLDPLYPKTRNQRVIDDSKARCILTDSACVDLAREMAGEGRSWIELDGNKSSLCSDSGSGDIGLPVSPDDFAYVLYTSGSTGEPKGVIQNHRNVLHFIMNYTNGLHVSPEDRLSLLYTWTNSAAAMDTFAALLNGAALFPFRLREEGTRRLGQWLIAEGITIYHSVASVFRSFVSGLSGREGFPALRLIDFGGEPVHKTDVEEYKEHFSPDCVLVNGFGTTEINVIRQFFIDKNTEITGALVPVGYQVEDSNVLLLGTSGEEVRLGDEGEICVESPFLAVGYWGRPELTNAAFSPSPRGGGRRIYHTGDLGRMEPDGCLTHLGRKDTQVKIRGHRVETGEVEVALRSMFGMEEAVVVARDYGNGGQRLVAYLVPGKQPKPTPNTLRSGLASLLPDFMIPSTFVMLDRLPRTPNGKLDRQALPAPETCRPNLETAFVAPRTALERMLADIWVDVLKVQDIGVHDNFFELGGDSLLAAQIMGRLHSSLDVDVSLRRFFEMPTLEGLAVAVVQSLAEQAGERETTRLMDELA